MSGRITTISLGLLLALSCYCIAQTVDPGAVRVGDRWSYDVKDDLTGDLRQAVTVVVVDVSDKDISTRVAVRGKDRPQTMIYDHDWGRIDDGIWKLRPSGIGIKRAAADRQRVALGRQGYQHEVRPRLPCVRACKGRRAGTGDGAGRDIRHVSCRHVRPNDRHQRCKISGLDLRGLVCARHQSLGKEAIGNACGRAAQRLVLRRAH